METGEPTWAYVALGANLADPKVNVLGAIERLRAFSDYPLKVSTLWETDPVDCPPGAPRFVNAVVGMVTRPGESPETLLTRLQALEREFGRVAKTVHNESRPLDLDLIAFGQETRSAPELTLPHPRTRVRRFVLGPLSEIAPDLLLPGETRTVAMLLHGLTSD